MSSALKNKKKPRSTDVEVSNMNIKSTGSSSQFRFSADFSLLAGSGFIVVVDDISVGGYVVAGILGFRHSIIDVSASSRNCLIRASIYTNHFKF